MSKILVVDDDQMLREAYALMLSITGYEVSTAYDGWDALEQYQRVKPDLILLDIHMPNLDGLGFLKELHKLGKPISTRIIVFSNLSKSAKIDEAMDLGVEKHIIKAQMTPKQLLEEINTMFGESSTGKEN